MDVDNGSKTESLHYIIMINVVFQGVPVYVRARVRVHPAFP